MKTFSLYRGQAKTGIGEGPGRPVHHGEQFLDADPPLNEDGELLSAARPWMTLDWRPADEQALGEKIEAWSYFPYGNLRFVVRLAAAGIYDRRAAYFAHARAFPADEFAGASDPGARLGDSQAFDEPWSDGRRPASRALGEPAPVRPEQILAEPTVAGALLAHLYQGLLGGYPVVMAVPVKDFERGGPLHALVSFARAALPLELKAGCRIRVFTRLPELFLRHLATDLLVLPESEAANALAARRNATLLDRTGARREGREFSLEAGQYAEAVLKRFDRLPGELLAFTGAIGEHFPKDRLPGDQELARIPAIYNLLATRKDPAILGNWIRTSLLKQVSECPTGLPWNRLIRPEDWRSLRSGDLEEIVLADVAGDEARGIVEQAREALRQQGKSLLSIDSLQRHWDGLPRPGRPGFLHRLLREELASPAQVAEWSTSLPLAEILASGPAALLLEAELQAGRLSRREAEGAELAAAATRTPQTAEVLARATSAGKLSESFALRLLHSEEVRDHLDTSTLLKLAGSAPSLGPWLDRRVEADLHDTITALLRADRWGAWRTGSSLNRESLRRAALAWLASDAWQGRPSPPRRLEDWKQVVDDLGSLTGAEIADLRGASKGFRWPWITPFEDVQLADLCRLVGPDLGALAELAESVDPERDLGYPIGGTIFEHVLSLADPALREALPPSSLSFLSNAQGAVLAPPEATLLFERTTHRRERAAAGLRRSIESFLDSKSAAALRAAVRLLSVTKDEGLIKVLRAWKTKQPPSRLEGEIGLLLDRILPAEGRVSLASGGGAELDPAVRALLQGAAENGCWKKLAGEVTGYVKAGTRAPHPVARLAAKLREVFPYLPTQEQKELEEKGWRTFSAVARAYPALLRQPIFRREPLPALELCALLRPRAGIGRIALSLAYLDAARDHILQDPWWESLLCGLACNRWGSDPRDPRDREEVALALILQEISDLFPTGSPAQTVQGLIGESMEKLYFKQGLYFARNLVPRATKRTGAAS